MKTKKTKNKSIKTNTKRLKIAQNKICANLHNSMFEIWRKLNLAKLKSDSGQGTTEYAILVGVLVVIAILAIMIFRPKLEELWNAISDGINGL